MKKVQITLKRSLISRLKGQVSAAHALGLRKPGQVVTCEWTPVIQGQVRKIAHLLEVKTLNTQVEA